jgi:two-component system, LytTR family, sensor kinase
LQQPVPLKGQALSLQDTVDIAVLQRIQDTFAKAMGFAAVTVDRSGRPVTRDSCFLPVCRMIRSTETGRRRCMQCDAEGGLAARERGGPYVYVCRGGLLDIAAPIIIEGEYLGCILCGQVLPTHERESLLEGILVRNIPLGLPQDELRQAADQIPSVPRERIDAAAEMLFQVANYIVEMGVANLAQAALLEETKRAAALQVALQESQLRMLESQINPHFLFNALGLISYTAIRERARETEEISYCLSDLLRYSLRNLAAPVTLGQEIEAVQRYLAIQKLRFGARLRVELDVDDSLRDLHIPCMILQPLVENAVVHAVEPLARPVTVRVRAERLPDGLQLEISDDGPGMASGAVEMLRSGSFTTRAGRDTVGLPNVIRRLQLEYGSHCRVNLDSQLGHGTRVTIRLPVAGGFPNRDGSEGSEKPGAPAAVSSADPGPALAQLSD